MPCLNEEHIIYSTCASLGFGLGPVSAPVETYLILVDNGSDDRTIVMMEQIKQHSPRGSVIVVTEKERGYVPPRHRGVLAAREIAAANNIAEESLLILQADADTQYSQDYISTIRKAADGQRNFLIEGTSRPPPGFDEAYPAYWALSERVDAPLRRLFVDDPHDVIVGDNICGYTLKDYFVWGGHVREFNSAGEEVYAETSRLFIRAKFLGAYKVRVNRAIAHHSRRKLIENPILQFATAGFPREPSWCAAWDRAYSGSNTLEAFSRPSIESEIGEAIFLRQAHSLVLFGLLPLYIASLLGHTEKVRDTYSELKDLLSFFRSISKEEIVKNTASLFECAFSIIKFHPGVLKKYLGVL